MYMLKIFPIIFYIYFTILFNILLYPINGDVLGIERIYKESLLINSPSSLHISSSHGKRIYLYREFKDNLDKQKQLSQILEKTNEKIDTLEIKNAKNTIGDQTTKMKKEDYDVSSDALSNKVNMDSSTTIESLSTIHDAIQSNEEYKLEKKDEIEDFTSEEKYTTLKDIFLNSDKISTDFSIDEIKDNNIIPVINLNFPSPSITSNFITTQKPITTISQPFFGEDLTKINNPLPEDNLLSEKYENNNLLTKQTQSKNKVTQPPSWNFGWISVKIENSLNFGDSLGENTLSSEEKNNKKYGGDDLGVINGKINNNSYNYTNFTKKNNTFFKSLNVKIENMVNEKIYDKKDFPKVINNITKQQEEVKNDDIKDSYKEGNKSKDNETTINKYDDSEKNEIEIFDDVKDDDDDVLSQLFNEMEEKNVSKIVETATIGEYVTMEEVQYDETDELEIHPSQEDEYDDDFLEEGERFDYNETMLTEFINDALKRDEETLRLTLVDKMLLEKEVPENTGDYSGSHIYPTLISQNYNNNSLPIMFSDIPVYVIVSIDILDISSFNMQSMDYSIDTLINMKWYDMRLVHGMRNPITVSEERILEKIWKPDTYIVNAKKSYLHKITFPNIKMRIFPDGLVLYTIHITFQPSCNMKFCMFPHDQQECYLDLSSLSYSDGQLKFIWGDNPFFLINQFTLPEFKLSNITVNECLSHDKLITSSCLRLTFKLQRDSAKYIVEKYIPSTLAMMFAWVAPYVPYNYEDVRIVTPITILLALVQMQKGEIETRTSYLTSLDKWFAVMKVFSVISLMESLIVLSLVRKFRELKKKENRAINEFEREMIKLQQREVKKLYNRIDLYARILSPVVFILYLIYYLSFMVSGVEEHC